MSLARAREVQQVYAGGPFISFPHRCRADILIGSDPLSSFGGPDTNGTALKDDGDTRAENTKISGKLLPLGWHHHGKLTTPPIQPTFLRHLENNLSITGLMHHTPRPPVNSSTLAFVCAGRLIIEALPPLDAIAAQPQSIWHKYVTIAEKWDRRMMEKWKTNMNNLLIFVRSLYQMHSWS